MYIFFTSVKIYKLELVFLFYFPLQRVRRNKFFKSVSLLKKVIRSVSKPQSRYIWSVVKTNRIRSEYMYTMDKIKKVLLTGEIIKIVFIQLN